MQTQPINPNLDMSHCLDLKIEMFHYIAIGNQRNGYIHTECVKYESCHSLLPCSCLHEIIHIL